MSIYRQTVVYGYRKGNIYHHVRFYETIFFFISPSHCLVFFLLMMQFIVLKLKCADAIKLIKIQNELRSTTCIFVRLTFHGFKNTCDSFQRSKTAKLPVSPHLIPKTTKKNARVQIVKNINSQRQRHIFIFFFLWGGDYLQYSLKWEILVCYLRVKESIYRVVRVL